MTINKWLNQSSSRLKDAGIDSAYLDSLLILEYGLKQDRALLIAHSENAIDANHLEHLNTLLHRRLEHEPIAYITGHIEFFGHEFIVDNSVLIPRPETESFIEEIGKVAQPGSSLLDLGCGSGAIGISAKLRYPRLNVTLSDIDTSVLVVAKQNANRLNASVAIIQSDLLNDNTHQYDIIAANLPYVPVDFAVTKELHFEPKNALYSGNDGLDHYRSFWSQLESLRTSYVLTESLEFQHPVMCDLAKEANFEMIASQLLVQVFKRTTSDT